MSSCFVNDSAAALCDSCNLWVVVVGRPMYDNDNDNDNDINLFRHHNRNNTNIKVIFKQVTMLDNCKCI